MEKIDFFAKKKSLHKEMVEATKNLLNESNVQGVDINDCCDTGFVTMCLESVEPTEYQVSRVYIEEGVLKAECTCPSYHIADLEDNGFVVLCSIDTIYESVYQKTQKMKSHE